MAGKEQKKEKASGNKGLKIAILSCAVVIIALLVVVIVLLLNRGDAEEPRRNVVVTPENAEEVAAQLVEENRTPIGSYEVTMNTTWNFEDGKSASDNAYVENAVSNTTPVYFDVVRSDTEETILASPILPVGTHLDEITLDQELSAGTYDCVCTYYLLDENDEPMSQVSVALQIVIRN